MNDRIAIVYDWMDSVGGVERLLLILHEIFPDAPFYTSFADLGKAPWAKNIPIRPSFMQTFPRFIRNNRMLSLPFFPRAFESFDFSEYRTVISVTSSFAKGIITRPTTQHICYLLTPTRFLWTHQADYFRTPFSRFISSYMTSELRNWDMIASSRPDDIISISSVVANRCRKFYGRSSLVVPPPFDSNYWKMVKCSIGDNRFDDGGMLPEKYYLVVSRLESYKRIDLAIKALRNSPIPLVVVGVGRHENKLKAIADENIIFLGHVTDENLGKLYTHAEALIMPQEEDYGYTAVEALYFGCPVIAYNAGGVKDTVDDMKTGIFFNDQSVKSIQTALDKYHTISYNIHETVKKTGEKVAEKNSKAFFQQRFTSFLR